MSKITAVTVPKWGIEMQEGRLTTWQIADASHVDKGEPIAEFETDKIVNELEAPATGLISLIGDEDEIYKVGALIGVISESLLTEQELTDFKNSFKEADTSFEPDEEEQQTTETPLTQTKIEVPLGNQVRVNPVVKRLAKKLDVDLSKVTGTGQNGRITKEDVLAVSESQTPPDAKPLLDEEYKLTAIERFASEKLTQAKQNIPHFYLVKDAEISNLKKACKSNNVSLNSAIMFAVSKSLKEYPKLNAHFTDNKCFLKKNINLATAVATEKGLLTPVVHKTENMTLKEFSIQHKNQISKAQNQTLAQQDLSDGTFTVSNLGMFGVREFSAIINAPQVAILALGSTRGALIEKAGNWVITEVMSLTLSCDHRVVDGALGAQFLKHLVNEIECLEINS